MSHCARSPGVHGGHPAGVRDRRPSRGAIRPIPIDDLTDILVAAIDLRIGG